MSQEALNQNREALSHSEELHEQLKQINYNLEHTSAEYIRAEFDDIEWNHEAYQILIDWLKSSLLSEQKLDRWDYSSTVFLQIIWKIKWIYIWKVDWSWWKNTEILLKEVFTQTELNDLEISWEWLLKKTYLTGETYKIKTKQKEDIQEENNIEEIKILKNPLEKSEKYGEFSKYTEIKEINWKEITILNDEIISCLNRYELNKEPLIKLLWKEKVNLFIDFLNTDYWNQLLNNTNYVRNINVIAENLQIVNIDSNGEWQELSNEILIETQRLAQDIWDIQNKINIELKNLMLHKAKVNNTMACHTPFRKIFSEQLNEKYQPLIDSKLKNYTRNVLEKIVLNGSAIWAIKSWQKIELPIWENDIVLDFSKLPKNINFDNITSEELLKITKDNFDDIYINTVWEKIAHNIEKAYNYAKAHPEKLAVDIVSIVLSWIVAIWTVWAISSSTWWLWTIPSIVVAWTSFTIADNTFRWIWYWIIWEAWLDSVDWEKWFREGFYEWLWIDWNNILSGRTFTKKWLELLTNTALFWIFKFSAKIQGTIIKSLEKNGADKTLRFFEKYINEYTKTIPEAMFFTEFWIWASVIEETISQIQSTQDINKKEAFDVFKKEFLKLHTPETMLQYFAYNLWFIWLVKIWIHKWWWQFLENKVTNMLLLKESNKVKKISDELNREILKLNSEWISLTRKTNWELVFYDRNLNLIKNQTKQLESFFEINKKLSEQVIDSQKILTNPRDDTDQQANSWKWTKAQANKILLNRKYQKLERLSKQTEGEWLKFALWKEWISKSIQEKWVQKWTKEWLMKEAWFTESEIKALKDYEAKKWWKELKDKAIERMNSAVEVVHKEFNNLRHMFFKFKKSWKEVKELLDNYDRNVQLKLEELFIRSIL